MPDATFFKHLGLFTFPGFLDSGTCSAVIESMRAGASKWATVMGPDGAFEIDEHTRNVRTCSVPGAIETSIAMRLAGIQRELETHFELRLERGSRPTFLRYSRGGQYRPHTDDAADCHAPEYLRRREVSIVIFLNAESREDAAGCYSGGALSFYGLLRDPRLARKAFPLRGETGLLIAFRSSILHAVEEVTGGERFTIVSWYLDNAQGFGSVSSSHDLAEGLAR